jgi:hypothetical protein
MKHEWRKKEKHIYLPKGQPKLIELPTFKYITIKGQGNPNNEDFARHVQTLYSIAYGIRMSYKWDNPPNGYYEYTVYPLEGFWDLIDHSKYVPGQVDKDNLKYEIMLRQPDFLDQKLFDQVMEIVKKKKAGLDYDLVELKDINEGLCVQMLHKGSYESEPQSFSLMEKYAKENGYERQSKVHKEIYLKDPKKTDPDKLQTVLRFKV